MDETNYIAELGSLVAKAKLASENPELEKKLKVWEELTPQDKEKVLNLSYE